MSGEKISPLKAFGYIIGIGTLAIVTVGVWGLLFYGVFTTWGPQDELTNIATKDTHKVNSLIEELNISEDEIDPIIDLVQTEDNKPIKITDIKNSTTPKNPKSIIKDTKSIVEKSPVKTPIVKESIEKIPNNFRQGKHNVKVGTIKDSHTEKLHEYIIFSENEEGPTIESEVHWGSSSKKLYHGEYQIAYAVGGKVKTQPLALIEVNYYGTDTVMSDTLYFYEGKDQVLELNDNYSLLITSIPRTLESDDWDMWILNLSKGKIIEHRFSFAAMPGVVDSIDFAYEDYAEALQFTLGNGAYIKQLKSDILGVLHLDYLDNGYLYDFNDTYEGIDDFGYFYVEYDIKGKPILLTTTPTRVTDINEYLNKGGWVKIGKEKDS